MTQDWSKVRIEETTLSTRAKTALLRDGFRTLGDVAENTNKELLLVPNFGKVSLAEVEEYIRPLRPPAIGPISTDTELRDRFAGQALLSLDAKLLREMGFGCGFYDIATVAYGIADAMLKARAKDEAA